MNAVTNRVTGKVGRIYSRLAMIFRMLSCTEKLPDISEALRFLQKVSPDMGKSCCTNTIFEQEERTFLLSVIVPAYNVEKYIVNCLDSVLAQKVSFEYEVIVINDGSTDATPGVLRKYCQNNRVRIIHQENRGLSAARNAGIALAKGTYLCFVDSDDFLPENALEHLVKTALKHQAKLVVGSYEKWSRDGKILKVYQAEQAHLPGYAWGRVIHYSVFQHIKFPEGYWFEDSIMAQIIHPMYQDATAITTQMCYCYYDNEAGIAATSLKKVKALDSLWITMRLLEDRKKYGLLYDQTSYEDFLSMAKLTYHRTKHLGPGAAQCIFVVQKMLLDRYYADYQTEADQQKFRIQEALRTNNFRNYILACERKR